MLLIFLSYISNFQQGTEDGEEIESGSSLASSAALQNQDSADVATDDGFVLVSQDENNGLGDQIAAQFTSQKMDEDGGSIKHGTSRGKGEKKTKKDTSETEELRFIFLQNKKREKKLKALEGGKLRKKELQKMAKDLLIELDGKNEIIREGKIYLNTLMNEKERLKEIIEEKEEIVSGKEFVINSLTGKEESYKETLQSGEQETIEKQHLLDEANNELRNTERKLRDQELIVKDMQAAIECLTNKKETESQELGTSFERRLELEALTRENDKLQNQLREKGKVLNEKQERIERAYRENAKLQGDIRETSREGRVKQLAIDRLTREQEQYQTERRHKESVLLDLRNSFQRTKEENKKLEEQISQKDLLLTEKERTLERLESLRRESLGRIENLESTLHSERQEQQREIARLRDEKRVCERRVRNLESDLQSQQRMERNLEFECTRARQSIDIYRKEQPWVIDRDEIILSEKVLGTGAWGRVLEGTFRGIQVAVKEIHQVISSAHNRFLFDREITFATLVRHPCLLQFMGVADYRTENPLLITELMDMSLSELLSRERITAMKYTMILAMDIARGTNYLHLFRPIPIIHRDISPGNVMVWRQGDRWRAKVCDFGSAEFQGSDMSVNPGNPFYSAPEASTTSQTTKVPICTDYTCIEYSSNLHNILSEKILSTQFHPQLSLK